MTSHHARGPLPLLETGTRIADRYVVVRSLGEGGMGQVFEVEHEAIGRHFALKVLNISPCTDETLRRFRREARALGRITTPRVAQVTDFGFEAGVGPFYIMELLDGETLEQRLEREHHLPAHVAIPVAIDLCEALAEVHEAGIIHRDLKPSNVGLVRLGPMRTKLLDFGLAAAADAAVLERITRSQEVVGSLPYMAPERFYNAPLTLSIDLYALGVVLYETLTGVLPFQGTSAAVLINQHLNEATPPFSSTAPGLQIPASLEAIVMRLLDKDPDQRFTSAAALGRAIQAAAIDVKTPTLAEDMGGASTVLAESSDELDVMTGEQEGHVVTVQSPAGPLEGDSEELYSGGLTEVSEPQSSLKSAARTGAAAGIPTSFVPGATTTPSSWPRPISPTHAQEDHEKQPPATFAQIGTPPEVSSPEGWESDSSPPPHFEPSDDFEPTRSRQWLKITAVLAAGVIGSTLAAILAFVLLLDTDEGSESTTEETLSQPRPIPETEKSRSPDPRQDTKAVEVDVAAQEKLVSPPRPPPPVPSRPGKRSTPTKSEAAKSGGVPVEKVVVSPSGIPLDTPDSGATVSAKAQTPTKATELREPQVDTPDPPRKTSPNYPWRGEIITNPN